MVTDKTWFSGNLDWLLQSFNVLNVLRYSEAILIDYFKSYDKSESFTREVLIFSHPCSQDHMQYDASCMKNVWFDSYNSFEGFQWMNEWVVIPWAHACAVKY